MTLKRSLSSQKHISMEIKNFIPIPEEIRSRSSKNKGFGATQAPKFFGHITWRYSVGIRHYLILKNLTRYDVPILSPISLLFLQEIFQVDKISS